MIMKKSCKRIHIIFKLKKLIKRKLFFKKTIFLKQVKKNNIFTSNIKAPNSLSMAIFKKHIKIQYHKNHLEKLTSMNNLTNSYQIIRNNKLILSKLQTKKTIKKKSLTNNY